MIWNLGSVSSQAEGTMAIKGVFLGTVGKKAAWQTVATYHQVTSIRDAQALETLPLLYAKSALRGTLTGEGRVMAGDLYTLTYEWKNETDYPLNQTVLRLGFPENFVSRATSSLPSLDGTSLALPLPALAAHATRTIQLVGAFRPSVSGEALFTADMGRQEAGATFTPFHRATSSVSVIPGDLGMHVIVNGTEEERTIVPGDLLHVTLPYQNTSPEHLEM